MTPLSLAYSSCPNDTFIFHAIAENRINTGEFVFDITMADVETLNMAAAKGRYDISKLSYAAYGNLRQDYALLRSGSALGRGCGPLIIARPGVGINSGEHPVIAVPGLGTTAFLLFSLYLAQNYPGIKPKVVPMPFEQIMPSVNQGSADVGVIIHEGRFVYEKLGFESLADLGQWWEEQTGLPIPLGCIAVRRDMDPAVARQVDSLIQESIRHARTTPSDSAAYIRTHAQELDKEVIDQHIHLYVNDFSLDIGDEGEAAVSEFFRRAESNGLIPASSNPLFAY